MKKINRKRKAAIAAAALLLFSAAGTFAWSSISQRALNEKMTDNQPGGRIHDDYLKETGNKNIYAENYGQQKLLVRIKLSEYLELNGTSLIANAEKDDRKTWEPLHVQAVETPGEDEEPSTWTIEPTGESAKFSPYVTWTLGGEKVFLPTFNQNNDSLSVDTTGDAIDEIAGDLNNGVSNAETPNGQTGVGNGTLDYFTAGDAYNNEGQQITPAPAEPTDTIHIAKETLTQERAPITMDQWKALDEEEQTGNYWILDENDGWAYWANYLNPGESTSMLLKQLNWQAGLDDYEEWYYGMDVTGQFATTADYATAFGSEENDGMSLNAEQLLALITKNEAPQTEFPPAENVGDTFKFNGEDFIYLADWGEGNYLILKKDLYGSSVSTTLNYVGGNLANAMTSYYNSLPDELKNIVQPVTLSTSNSAVTAVDTVNGTRTAFALSYEDLRNVTGTGKAFENNASRSVSGATWWLRSRTSGGDQPMFINTDGLAYNSSANQNRGVRPALVIHPTKPLTK